MQKVQFSEVCKVFDEIEKTSSRNDTTYLLAEFFKTLNPKDAQILSYFVLGRVAPSFVNSEFNYSEKSILNLLEMYAKSVNKDIDIKGIREKTGDIGDTVYEVATSLDLGNGSLLLEEIYDLLWSIVNTTGTGSVDAKNSIVLKILNNLSPLESKYFLRIVCGSLRFGINYKTLLDVFSYMISGDKSVKESLNRGYGVCGDIGYICSKIVGVTKEESLNNLEKIQITPGIPVLSRLVERVQNFEEVFERLGSPILVQPKFDGLRCQIHKYKSSDFSKEIDLLWSRYAKKVLGGTLFGTEESSSEVKLFTRNLEDVTEMFPEIVEAAKSMNSESFVLDSEVLGWDGKKFLPFQDTMQRRRKYGVGSLKNDIPVKAMCFDILFLEGKPLFEDDTVDRVDILNGLDTKGGIEKCLTKSVDTMDDLKEEFQENVDKGYEGIIVKQLSGKYLPGVRNYEWIKLKKSMMNALVDTVDLVAIGYYRGSGRRADLGVGAVLGALYNEEEDVFEGICKVGTGISDDMLRKIKESLDLDIVNEQLLNVRVPKSLLPDVFVYPKIVFTVEADEITKRIEKGDEKIGGGLSLRFPRLVEWSRDKGVAEATSVKELLSMFRSKEIK